MAVATAIWSRAVLCYNSHILASLVIMAAAILLEEYSDDGRSRRRPTLRRPQYVSPTIIRIKISVAEAQWPKQLYSLTSIAPAYNFSSIRNYHGRAALRVFVRILYHYRLLRAMVFHSGSSVVMIKRRPSVEKIRLRLHSNFTRFATISLE